MFLFLSLSLRFYRPFTLSFLSLIKAKPALMAEFHNVEMHASQQHGITHATGYPKGASVGYNDHDSSIREWG